MQSEVLGITIWSDRDLETLLQGFNAAYNARRRQRVLEGDARMRSCEAAWSLSRSWSTGATSRPIQTLCRQPSGSSLAPRRSRIQTARTFSNLEHMSVLVTMGRSELAEMPHMSACLLPRCRF